MLEEQTWPNMRYSNSICLERERERGKTTQPLVQGSHWPGQDSKQTPLKYRSEAVLFKDLCFMPEGKQYNCVGQTSCNLKI